MIEKFKCETCGNVYSDILKGGTDKLIGNPVEYSLRNVKSCAYCVGSYPDNTPCNSGKRGSHER